ncbi:restriction endonuclease subunit S [Bosea sp. (in: a-proteobacteria)]|uniref:restriction endonuclease subunit S n=1 Tax=Bosea sp. (in: a-proteobacteria) TaxID=1871050 RepID=UPI003F6F7EDB
MQLDLVPPTGDLPPGWKMTPLAELCFIQSGGTPSKANPTYWQGTIPWVSGKDLKAPRLYDAIDHVSEQAIGDGTRLAPAGAVFILVRGMGLAKDLPVALAMRAMAFNQDLKALIPKRPGTGGFIRAAIYDRREELLSRIVPSAHGTMTLNLDDIEKFEIPLPVDAQEASAVAAALSLVMDLVAKSGEELVATQTLKSAVMASVFRKGLRGASQKPSNFGETPDTWELRPIGELVHQMQYGLSVRGEASGTYPILRMNCQLHGKVVFRDLQYVDIEPGIAKAYRVLPGDVLFNRTNSFELVGRTAIVETETDAVFASYLVRVSVNEKQLDPRFLTQFLNWDTAQAELKKLASRGVSQANISAGKLRDFAIPVPELGEQREIVAILDTIDFKIELHRKKRAALDGLFKALMHKLMTGQIRVADLDLSALAVPTVEAAA